MLFGLNDANTPVPGQTAQRTYHTPNQAVPRIWDKTTPAGITPIDSIRPKPADVISKKLDVSLVNYWNSLPPNSMVTLWHEANDQNQNQQATQIKAMHQHANQLIKSHGIKVEYGVILGGYPIWHQNQRMSDWVPPLPHGSWIGCDTYANSWDNPPATPQNLFGRFTDQAKLASPYSQLLVTETNVGEDMATLQEDWLNACLDFAIINHYIGFCPWGNPQLGKNIALLDRNVLSDLARRASTSALAHV